MKPQAFDSTSYKAGQQRDWDAVASGWSKWWPALGVGAGYISQHMIDLADIQPGQRVLDVATGIGEPAISAARRSGLIAG